MDADYGTEICNVGHCKDEVKVEPGVNAGFDFIEGEIMWVKLECKLPMVKNVRRLSSDAFRWYIYAMCYCGEHLTDGKLDSMDIETITSCMRVSENCLQECIDLQLVVELDAWQYELVGFSDTQTSREYVEKRRADDRARKAKAGLKTRSIVDSAADSAVESIADSDVDSTRKELRIKNQELKKDMCIREINTNSSSAIASDVLTSQKCIAIYVDAWTEKYGRAPSASLAGLGAHFKRVIGKTPDDTIKGCILAFFTLTDTWIVQNAHKPTSLISQWDSLVTGAAFTGSSKTSRSVDIADRFRESVLEQIK